jgi:hypothetical protein
VPRSQGPTRRECVADLAAVGVAPIWPVQREEQFVTGPGDEHRIARHRLGSSPDPTVEPGAELLATQQGGVGEGLRVQRIGHGLGFRSAQQPSEHDRGGRVGCGRGVQRGERFVRVRDGDLIAGRWLDCSRHEGEVKRGGNRRGSAIEGDTDEDPVCRDRGCGVLAEVDSQQRLVDLTALVQQRSGGCSVGEFGERDPAGRRLVVGRHDLVSVSSLACGAT